jgi:hypothetical protein
MRLNVLKRSANQSLLAARCQLPHFNQSLFNPPLAAILEGALDVKGKRVGITLTGGNIDLDTLPWLIS